MNGTTYLIALREAIETYNLPEPYGIILDHQMFEDILDFTSRYDPAITEDARSAMNHINFNGFFVERQ